MYDQFSDKGLQIIAFPCNQFGAQEPEDAEWIADFVKKSGVNFPVMDKIDVNGDGADNIFKFLRNASDLKGEPIGWNFQKFLVDSEGNVKGTWDAKTEPNSFKSDIEKLL